MEKIDDPSIGAVIFNQAIEPIAIGPATLVAGDIHYGELADEIAEIGWRRRGACLPLIVPTTQRA